MTGFKHLHFGGAVVVVALVAGQGCAAVTFQDAKMLGKGKLELTPTVALAGVSGEGESEALGPLVGANLSLGLTDKVDLIGGYHGFSGSIGPKISLVQDRAALLVPVTIGVGLLQVGPAAVFSVPLGNGVTFNPGAKVVWTNCDGCELLLGASAGLSVPFGNRVVLRPEIGMLKIQGEPGMIWAFGVGLSLRSR